MCDRIKITRNKAIKLYNQGARIILIPSKARFTEMPFSLDIELCKLDWVEDINEPLPTDIETLINEFIYYNCNSEVGQEVHFYIYDTFDQWATEWAEKYGIVNYTLKDNILTYRESFHSEHITYKCEVNVITDVETRTPLKRFYKKAHR